MIDLIVAAALMQTGDPCMAVPQGSTTRSCPQWRLVRHYPRFDYYVNPASIVRHGDTFEIALRIIYPADRPRGTRSAVSWQRLDCASRTSVMLHIITYNAAGAVLVDRDARPDEAGPDPSPPGSPGEALLAEYCQR